MIVSESEPCYERHRNGPDFPLEIKDMIIDQLANCANPTADNDLRAMMYVWPESLRTIRKHRFAYVELIFKHRDSKTSLKRLARLFTLLQNSPTIGDFVTELILWDDDDRTIFPLSRISYFPRMLTSLSNVRRLVLKELSFLPSVMPNFPTFVSALSGFGNIQSLEIYNCAFDFLDLVALLNAVPSLKELSVGSLQIRAFSVRGRVVQTTTSTSILSDNGLFEGGPILRFAPGPNSMPRLATTTLHLDKVALTTVEIGDFIFWDFLWSSGLIGSLRELYVVAHHCGSIVTQRMHDMIDCTRSSLQSLHLDTMGVAIREGRPMDLAHLRKLRFELMVGEWRLHDAGDPAILDWYIRTFQNLPSHTLLEELTIDVWTFLNDSNYSDPFKPGGPDIRLWRDLDEAFVGPQMGLQKLTFVVRTVMGYSDVPWEVARRNTERWLLDVCLPRTREHFFVDNNNQGRVGIIAFEFPEDMEEDESP